MKQQLKHTDVHSLCSVASADKAASAQGNRAATSASMAGMVHDFQEMAASGGRGVRGGMRDMLAALKNAFGGTARGRTHMRRVK